MTGSNLPPGVSENMIPGNRPKDDDDELFWEEWAARMAKESFDTGPITPHRVSSAVIEGLLEDVVTRRGLELARDLAWNIAFQEGRAEEQMAQGLEQADAPVSLPLTPAVVQVLLRPLRVKAESAGNQRNRYQQIKDENAARGMVAEVDDLIEAFADEERETRAILELVEGVIAHGG
jgi:hypothetical protein